MLLFLAKRSPCYLIHFLRPRSCSSSATQPPHFMVDYLTAAFGISPDNAARISKPIAYVTSAEKPDSVRHFLKHHGFTQAQIKTIVIRHPIILCSSPEKTLEPNLRALREMGFSIPALTQIIVSDPLALHLRTAVPRIKFLKDFLDDNEVNLTKAIKKNRGLTSNYIAPKISFLRSHGLSTHEIQRILRGLSGFFSRSTRLMEDDLHRAKELGFHPGLPMFVTGLQVVYTNPRVLLQKKMELYKSFGWSEDVFFSAMRKFPKIVAFSGKYLQMKMGFLVEEAGCDPSYIASNPVILSYSLEKRLRPRHCVLHLLESKGLYSKGQNFYVAMVWTDNKFVERYIVPHKEEISGLHEAYLAACA